MASIPIGEEHSWFVLPLYLVTLLQLQSVLRPQGT